MSLSAADLASRIASVITPLQLGDVETSVKLALANAFAVRQRQQRLVMTTEGPALGIACVEFDRVTGVVTATLTLSGSQARLVLRRVAGASSSSFQGNARLVNALQTATASFIPRPVIPSFNALPNLMI
jgi:hypothetical protein